MADLRLLVVAADPLARAGLVTLLDERPGLHIAGQVSGGESLAEELDVFQPDVLVFDLGWEPDEGLETLEERSAGARGVLPRTASAGGLEAAIHGVALGLAVIEPELLANAWPAGSSGEPGLDEALTPRELEVLQLLAEGLANKAIAQRLDISEHTVKFHVNAIMSKLGAQSRTAAVVRATRLGLIML
jgi:DNA-binding NarL/FixJ family response regulator